MIMDNVSQLVFSSDGFMMIMQRIFTDVPCPQTLGLEGWSLMA